MIRAVIFDFRDTILNVRPAYAAAHDALFAIATNQGVPLERPAFDSAVKTAFQQIIEEYGRPPDVHDWATLAVQKLFTNLGRPLDASTLETAMTRYTKAFVERVDLYSEAKEVLDKLKDHRVKLGLVIDGTVSRERAIIARLGLEKYFDAIVISEEVGKNKFTPEPLKRALESLDVPASEVLVVGDRIDKDIVHANRLGCMSVKLDRPGSRHAETTPLLPEEKPRYTIQSLLEILPLVGR